MAVTKPIDHKQLTKEDTYLIYLAEKGISWRYGSDYDQDFINERVIPRVHKELEIIIRKGFTDYFLILGDLIMYCLDNGIAIGVGRGSAAGSIVAYCLGITEVEPLRFNLLFERFLNMERFEYPDIDTDVDWARRQEVIQYLSNKYGEDKVAQIVTFGTLSPKTLIQDVSRVLKIPAKDAEELKALVPETEKATFQDCLDSPEFVDKLLEIEGIDSRILTGISRLEGLHRHTSIHAAGVVIATKPISEIAPVYRPIGEKHKDVRPVVQYEKGEAEAVGLLKMDILGLRTVTLVDWAEKDVRKYANPDFYTRQMSLDQKEAFDIINRGDTDGIFQLEGTGITKFAMDFEVRSFDELVALISLYRPGTLDSGMADQYIKRKKGLEPVTYPHPDLEWILKDTYGVMVYQEQIMQVAGVMCGYTMGQADGLRSAVGKKNKVKIQKELSAFTKLALERGYEPDLVEYMAGLIETFGRYGFNKSHAVSYAYLTYWTAYLKAVYPACFYTALMNTANDQKVPMIVDRALAHGIELLPPDVNESGIRFSLNKNMQVRFGLANVKGIGSKFVEPLLASREANGDYRSFFDFCYRNPSIPINAKIALISSGAFDSIGTRQEILFQAKERNIAAKALDYAKYAVIEAEYQAGKAMGMVKELKPLELGQMEFDTLGYYITADPKAIIREAIAMMHGSVGKSAAELQRLGKTASLGGQLTSLHPHKTKKGDPMAFITLDDGIVKHEVTIFPDLFKKLRSVLVKNKYFFANVTISEYRGQPSMAATYLEEIDIDARQGDISVSLPTDPISAKILASWLRSLPEGQSRVKITWRDSEGFKYKLLHRRSVALTRESLDQISSLFRIKWGG